MQWDSILLWAINGVSDSQWRYFETCFDPENKQEIIEALHILAADTQNHRKWNSCFRWLFIKERVAEIGRNERGSNQPVQTTLMPSPRSQAPGNHALLPTLVSKVFCRKGSVQNRQISRAKHQFLENFQPLGMHHNVSSSLRNCSHTESTLPDSVCPWCLWPQG